jgi:bacteriocin biosynthesis cyclodehydratase domain-containing protein
MRPVLEAASPLLRRDAAHLQLGTDPADAVVVRDMPGIADVLRRCDGLRSRDEVLGAVAPALRRHLGEALDVLVEAGVLVDADEQMRPELAGETVRLTGSGRTRSSVAAAVASRRTRTVVLLGPPILVDPLAALLADCATPVRVRSADAADLVVLAGHPEPDRDDADACVRNDVPHLLASLHPRSAALGPLVRPGRTACLRCADSVRAESDPAWTALVTQLGNPVQRPAGAPHASPLLVATLVTAAAAAVLAALDGASTAVDDGVLRWTATCGLPSLHRLRPQPSCGCTRLH